MTLYKAKKTDSDEEVVGFLTPTECILNYSICDKIERTMTWAIVPIDDTFLQHMILGGAGYNVYKMPTIPIDISTLEEIPLSKQETEKYISE